METRELLIAIVALVAILALWVLARGLRAIRLQSHRSAVRLPDWAPGPAASYDDLLRAIRKELARKLVGRLDWSRSMDELKRDLRPVVGHLIDAARPGLNLIERQKLIEDVIEGIKPPG